MQKIKMARPVPNKGGKSLRIIRNVYLYLVAMIGLIVLVIGSVGVVNNVLKNYVFQVDESVYMRGPYDYDECKYSPEPVPIPEGGKRIELSEEEIKECEVRMADQKEAYRENEMRREFSISIAQILIGWPLWYFHWGIIQREYRRKKFKK